jgi:hypothetical protein
MIGPLVIAFGVVMFATAAFANDKPSDAEAAKVKAALTEAVRAALSRGGREERACWRSTMPSARGCSTTSSSIAPISSSA